MREVSACTAANWTPAATGWRWGPGEEAGGGSGPAPLATFGDGLFPHTHRCAPVPSASQPKLWPRVCPLRRARRPEFPGVAACERDTDPGPGWGRRGGGRPGRWSGRIPADLGAVGIRWCRGPRTGGASRPRSGHGRKFVLKTSEMTGDGRATRRRRIMAAARTGTAEDIMLTTNVDLDSTCYAPAVRRASGFCSRRLPEHWSRGRLVRCATRLLRSHHPSAGERFAHAWGVRGRRTGGADAALS